MPNPVIQQLTEQVAATTAVIDSAEALIRGITAQIEAAVAKVLANGGATAAEMAPVNEALNVIKQQTSELAAAVEENTPAAE